MTVIDKFKQYKIEEYFPQEEPFYLDVDGETEVFMACYKEKIPVTLKGPTGCGKTRFVERMSYDLNRPVVRVSKKDGAEDGKKTPLITVPGNEDLTADDLKGRYLLDGSFQEGAALIAVKNGGILYLDEIVEARNDTTVVIHPLADHRRSLVIEKLGKVYEAPDNFMLVISYNPGYQRKVKDLKQSTKQRFGAINFTYPSADIEQKIIMHEANVDEKVAKYLTTVGEKVRNLKGKGLDEGASTRLLINAGKLIRSGIDPVKACDVAILNPLTDDIDAYKSIREGLADVVTAYFPGRK
ncbi:MAG: CbbQ/NirQ/NorQ/GpvN family protein [Nanoarchaeota archaeon]|nr:CbbQ/NirQ/NorQ/GpvN family protein [Nanoarchaeota archaeon]